MKKLSIEEVKNRIFQIHRDVVTLDESTYKNTTTKARFIDKDYGVWWAFLKNIFQKKNGHRLRAVEKRKKTTFERYGVEYSQQNKEIRKKRKQTSLEHYGFEHPLQNKEIAAKAAKNQNNSYILNHWKTNVEIVCVALYEKKCVERWNTEKEDFEWQIAFNMPNGKVYFVDAHLPRLNKYIEIKGYFRKDAKEKWDWFHETHPNSELWDEKKLKELKIL